MCAKRQRYIIDDLKSFADTKGGKCLSLSYSDNKALYIWQCEAAGSKYGHRYFFF